MLMPQSNTVTLFLTLLPLATINSYLLWLVSVLKLVFSGLEVSEMKNMENMIFCKYGAIIYILQLTFYMKLMTASCSMSIVLPIVTIFI